MKGHIRYQDARDLKKHISTELNIEGYPNPRFLDLIYETCPDQVTFVPDAPDVLTSNAGWNCKENFDFLKEIIEVCKSKGIRTSLFMECDLEQLEWAKKTGTDRIELYTEEYATAYANGNQDMINSYAQAAQHAHNLGLEINAGHDLDLNNLQFFQQNIPHLKEVSIGHALICDALYYGIQNTIGMYLNQLKHADSKS